MGRGRDRRGDDLYLPADALGKVAFHWSGSEASATDDFRLSEHSPYPTRVGRKDATVSGSPANADSLGDTDGRAKSMDGSDDEVTLSDSADLDAAAGEDLVVAVAVTRASTSSAETIIQKWSGTVGWRLRLQSDGTVDFIADDNTSEDRAQSTTAIDDGNVHTIVGTIDRGGSNVKIFVDGAEEASVTNNAGSIANSSSVQVAATDFSGTVGVWHVDKTWATEPQAAYWDDLIADRTKWAPQLNRFVIADPVTGYKRRPIDYLQQYGLWENAFEVWDASRSVGRLDGEGVVQQPNLAGPWRGSAQRTGADQLLANGPTNRGERADYLSGSGGVSSYSGDGPSTAASSWVQWGVIRGAANTNTFDVGSYADFGGNGFIRTRRTNSSTCRFVFDDDNGNRFVDNIIIDNSVDFAYVARIDFATDDVRVVAKNSDGATESISGSPGYNAGISGLAADHYLSYDGRLYRRGDHPDATMTNTEQDNFLDDLAATENF